MILYHGTTDDRAKEILSNLEISNNCERFFTVEENGDGYTTQGYVYLTNEITYALYFANSHHFVDKSDKLYIFKIDVPDHLIEPDYDEMRYQDPTGFDRERYSNDLECSLLEFKTCRIPIPIEFSKFSVEYFVVDRNDIENMSLLFDNAGYDYKYVTSHYTRAQKEFIESIRWTKV